MLEIINIQMISVIFALGMIVALFYNKIFDFNIYAIITSICILGLAYMINIYFIAFIIGALCIKS